MSKQGTSQPPASPAHKTCARGGSSNQISAAFIVDLLVVVLVFFIWSYTEAKRYNIKNIWIIWMLTILFGMAGTFPLFNYMIERKRHNHSRADKRLKTHRHSQAES